MPVGSPGSATTKGSELLYSNLGFKANVLTGSLGAHYFMTPVLDIAKFSAVRMECYIIEGQFGGPGGLFFWFAESYDGVNIINHYVQASSGGIPPRSNFYTVKTPAASPGAYQVTSATETYGPKWLNTDLGFSIAKTQPMPPFGVFLVSINGIFWPDVTVMDLYVIGFRARK